MASQIENLIKKLIVPPGKTIELQKDYDPAYSLPGLDKQQADQLLAEGIQQLADYQAKLYAQDTYALLIVLQALDAAGKDGTIKHVMTGLNPQGTRVVGFKVPSATEMNHDYLWRHYKELPERGEIGIFNRSYYEELLVARVHPEILGRERIPETLKGKKIWKKRFDEINSFEKFLTDNGTVVLKFFLNVSKDEQRKRFLERIDLPEKNWKFSTADLHERAHWDEYQMAYEDLFNHTSTSWAPWYVLPADHKWVTHLSAAALIFETLRGLKLDFPTISEPQVQALALAKEQLEAEGGPLQSKAEAAAPEPQPEPAGDPAPAEKKKKGKGKQKSAKKARH